MGFQIRPVSMNSGAVAHRGAAVAPGSESGGHSAGTQRFKRPRYAAAAALPPSEPPSASRRSRQFSDRVASSGEQMLAALLFAACMVQRKTAVFWRRSAGYF
jgi:hypothetical protein